MSEQPKDDKEAIGPLGRQEALTALIIGVLAMIPAAAIVTLIFVYSNPDIAKNLTVTGAIDVGRFVEKVIESYDAFLLLLGVGIGIPAGAAMARRK